MAERPKRDAVTNREGTDTLLHLQKRRTGAEVLRDKEIAASAKAAAKAQKAAIAAQKKNSSLLLKTSFAEKTSNTKNTWIALT